MDWARIKPWENVVNAVAREYAKKFDMVDIEDIRQELYGWFLKHPVKLDEWEALGKRDAKNLIYRSLRNQALDYCQYWKAKGGGYELDDLFYYTPEMLEALLPTVLLGINDAPAVQLSLGKTSRPTVQAEGGNLATMLAEIDKGQHKLSKDDQRVIHLRFGLMYEFPEIQQELGLNTEDAARARLRRAINRLINKIGGRRPFREDDDASVSDNATEDTTTE